MLHYELVEQIGEGGMGVVWRARDEKLRRNVALKILPAELAADRDRRRRLIHEARAAAIVNHPNIAAVHDVDEVDGQVFFAMELVEGESLRARLASPLPLTEALRLAADVAEGLASVHAANLVHRDLKPENVMIRPDGHVKILDFGLAKMLEEREELTRSKLSQAKTRTDQLTRKGQVLGTAPYMSPEQAKGEALDSRSDVFSFGSMLYEMATGEAAFARKSMAEVLSAVLRERPPAPSTVKPELPPELDRILGKCLEKDPRERYQDAADLAVDLRKLRLAVETGAAEAATPGGGVMVPSRREARAAGPSRRPVWMIGTALLVATVAVSYWWVFVHPGSFEKGDRIIVAQFENTTDREEYRAAVRDVLEARLANSSFLKVIRRPQLQELVKAHAGELAPLTRILASEICDTGACEGYVTGRIGPEESGYRVEVSLFRRGRTHPVLALSRLAPSEDDLLETILEIGRDLRRRSGEAPESLPSRKPSGTRSLLAFHVLVLLRDVDFGTKRIPLIERALELDPEWEYMYSWLALENFNLGRWREYRKYAEEAHKRTSGKAESDQLIDEALYLSSLYDFDAELQLLNRGTVEFPSKRPIWNFLGALQLLVFRDPVAAEPLFQRRYELSPSYNDFLMLLDSLAVQGKIDEMERLVEQSEEKIGKEWQTLGAIKLQAVRGDLQAVDEAAELLRQESGDVALLAPAARLQALLALGHLREAEEEAAVAWRTAARSPAYQEKHMAGLKQAWLDSRRSTEAIVLTDEQSEYSRDNLFLFPEFATLSVELGIEEPLATFLDDQEDYERNNPARYVREELRFGRACLALIRGDAQGALRLLEPLARNSILLRRHRVLGRTYVVLGQWARAAAEYETVVRNPYDKWRVYNNPAVFVLDQFRLAQIYERLGNTDRARHWYKRFLDDWKTADPDIPELIEAKERMAVLVESRPDLPPVIVPVSRVEPASYSHS